LIVYTFIGESVTNLKMVENLKVAVHPGGKKQLIEVRVMF